MGCEKTWNYQEKCRRFQDENVLSEPLDLLLWFAESLEGAMGFGVIYHKEIS